MTDPILVAIAFRFSYRRLWHRGGHTWASALPASGGGWTNACGANATDALLVLLARSVAGGAVDA